MAVPRHRTSNAAKNSRRAHHAKKPKQCTVCTNCGAMHLGHQICSGCGYYKNRAILKKKGD